MQFKLHTLTVAVLVSFWAWPARAEQIVEYIDAPNQIAWLPEGTQLVLAFLLNQSQNMIAHYGLALERIKSLRKTVQSLPPAYGSIALFYDNDIQQPIDKDKIKPMKPERPGYGKDAFRNAFETIQSFAGKRIPPLGNH